jgi:hypothetical protein
MSLCGALLCDFSKDIDILYTEWRKMIRKIWKIPKRSHRSLLAHIAESTPINVILQQRFMKFVASGVKSKNDIVNNVFKNMIYVINQAQEGIFELFYPILMLLVEILFTMIS